MQNQGDQEGMKGSLKKKKKKKKKKRKEKVNFDLQTVGLL